MMITFVAQSFPYLHHGPGVEFAVAEQSLAGGFLLIGRHVLDAWENGHGIAAVLHPAVEVVVVERGLIGTIPILVIRINRTYIQDLA